VELGYCCKALPETNPLCFPALTSGDTAKTPIGSKCFACTKIGYIQKPINEFLVCDFGIF